MREAQEILQKFDKEPRGSSRVAKPLHDGPRVARISVTN